MNLESYNYNVPEFVKSADQSNFDIHADSALVVGGLRIDNPAAVWVAGAEIRKHASRYTDSGVIRMVKEASALFNITDDMFTPAVSADLVEITDGHNKVAFNINDSESLNEAAATLISKRASLPYTFASQCAQSLKDIALENKYEFSRDNQVAIRKLAGDYNVDFAAGRELLMQEAKIAEANGLDAHAKILTKIASICTDDCSADMAPYFIVAVDEFRRGCPTIRKSASESARQPEDVFYRSNAEYTAQLASRKLDIAGTGSSVTATNIHSNIHSISKWASVCGYSISPAASAEDVVEAVAKMPTALRDEFVDLFGDK